MSQSGILNLRNSVVPPTVAQTYVTDAGTAIPSSNILNVLGDDVINTSGSGNTIVIHNPNPSKVISDFNDFITGSGNLIGYPGVGLASIPGTATNPGIVTFSGGGSNGIFMAGNYGSNPNADSFALGGGSLSLNWVFDLIALSTNTDTYTVFIGFMDAASVAGQVPISDGVYFQYTNSVNGGNWQIVCTKGGVSTTANTITPAATGFHNYGVSINAAGTSAAFTINGVAVANSPIASNIPTNPISPAIYTLQSAGTVPDQEVDLIYYTQILTVAR